MLARVLPKPVVGVLTFVLKLVVLLFWFVFALPFVLLHLIPGQAMRDATSRAVVFVARCWTATNRRLYRLVHPMDWQIQFEGEPLDPRKSYLLVANHQSWADILILFALFHGRAPFLRFFLKDELKYVPIIGLVCWAMEFPFMKRYSKEALAKNPGLRNEDLETTRKKCEVYRRQPVTIVNFLEGTRFTEAKRQAKASPYRHLLPPKSAGLAFTLRAMGEQFAGLVDVTLAYPPGPPGRSLLWRWLCGELGDTRIHVRVEPIPAWTYAGDYESDADFRARFQAWITERWTEKDARLARAFTN